jgi:hypothetical protein
MKKPRRRSSSPDHESQKSDSSGVKLSSDEIPSHRLPAKRSSAAPQIPPRVAKPTLKQVYSARRRLQDVAKTTAKSMPSPTASRIRTPVPDRHPPPKIRPRAVRVVRRALPPPPPPDPCQQAVQASTPTALPDQVWSNWGIVDSPTTIGGQLLTQWLFQPTNPYEIASAIQQAEAAGSTIRALGSGWSFSDAALPQPSALTFAEVMQLETELAFQIFTPLSPQAWTVFGFAVDTTSFARSCQASLAGILLPQVDPSLLFFVEAGIQLSTLNQLLNSQNPPLALKTLGGSAGQTLGGAISTGTSGGDFDRPPLADSTRAIYLIGAGGVHYWIEPASRQITAAGEVTTTFPCISVDNCRYDDDLFNAVLVSMGGMGVIYAVILDVVPQYCLIEWNRWTTWEALKQENAGNPGFQNLFDGTWSTFGGYLEAQWPSDLWGTGRCRFVQVAVNPIKNDDGTHNCYVTNRAQVAQLTPLPIGIENAPSAAQNSDLQNAITSSPDFGLGADITFGADEAILFGTGVNLLDPGPTEVQQAQQLISFCKRYGYFWAIRAVIDEILKKRIPETIVAGPGSNPYIDLGFNVMTGASGGSSPLNLKGSVTSAEAMFPFADAVAFVDTMLAQFDAAVPQNAWPAGYLSLRSCGPSGALLAPEQFGKLGSEPLSNVTGAVEMSLLLNNDAIGFIQQFEETVISDGGILHWGQSNGLLMASKVQQSFPRLRKWKEAQRLLGGNTFVNSFMVRCGLVATGSAGWIILLDDNAYWYGNGFPVDAAAQIGTMVQAGNTLEHVRFAPDGTWMIIGAGNYRWYSAGFPSDLGDTIELGIANGQTLVDVYIAPDGEWMIQWAGNQGGARTYQASVDFPADIVAQTNTFDLQGTGQALVSIVFPPSGGWLGIWEANGFFAAGAPDDTVAKIQELVQEGFMLQDVVFSAADGWMIVMANNAFWANGSFDQDVFNKIEELVAENYALVDVIMGVPSVP